MAHLSKIFNKTKVDIPNRSGFDISHENMLTMRTGTLTPVLLEEVLPNETYSLGYMCQAQLPPMATDFYGRVDMRLEAFFVPNRILWSEWQNFVTMPVSNPFSPTVIRPEKLPGVVSTTNEDLVVGAAYSLDSLFGAGSLADYLGIKLPLKMYESQESFTYNINNILPFLAYHRIYDEWYRNPNITKPLFVRRVERMSDQHFSISQLPWASPDGNNNQKRFEFYVRNSSSGYLALGLPLFFTGNDPNDVRVGGKNLFSLHQRQWAKDYYTTASLYPQANGSLNGASVLVDGNNSIGIGALRSANVLQRWLERNNIAGQRYADQIKATWGVLPSDALIDRPIFLGSHKFGLYNKSISQNSQQAESTDTRNPFAGSLGSKGGNMNGMGDGSLIDKFTTTEHGFIVVLASIVPHAYYSTGTRRLFKRSEIGDFANPLLQGLGEQAIYVSELSDVLTVGGFDREFGYQQQYAEYKYHDDEVHGLLRDGESLSAFALQRGFLNDGGGTNYPQLNTSFLEIPPNFMDSVTAADYSTGSVTWADFYFNFKKTSPLSEYVIPTLGDLKNTHKEDVDYRGRYL